MDTVSSLKGSSGNPVLPMDLPVIAQFSYLHDCQVKIPVSIREKDGNFFMKSPVKPYPEWKLNLIIRSIDFPQGHVIRLSKSPFSEVDYWDSNIIKKVAHSEFAEIYEITEPKHFQITSLRKSTRIFCLTAIRCFVGENETPVRGTCIDISEDGLGMGLRFEEVVNVQIGDKCRILFESPFDNLPELTGKIVRQSTSALDHSISAGVVLKEEFRETAQKVVQFIAQRQSTQSTDSFIQSPISQNAINAGNNLITNIVDSIPKDFFSMFK